MAGAAPGKGGASGGPSIANHPRARYQVRRAKGWGGIAGFAIAGYLSYKAGVPTFDVGMRALVAGIVGYMLAWMCAVTVWRHLVQAELRAALELSQAPDPDLIPARQPGTSAKDAGSTTRRHSEYVGPTDPAPWIRSIRSFRSRRTSRRSPRRRWPAGSIATAPGTPRIRERRRAQARARRPRLGRRDRLLRR